MLKAMLHCIVAVKVVCTDVVDFHCCVCYLEPWVVQQEMLLNGACAKDLYQERESSGAGKGKEVPAPQGCCTLPSLHHSVKSVKKMGRKKWVMQIKTKLINKRKDRFYFNQ